MKKRLFFLVTYFLFWVIYFVITKIVFLLYHYRLSAELDLATILLILFNGLKLDLSFTAYISVIPFFIISLSYYLPDRFTKYSITFYTIIILILISLLTVIDLELYTYWEYRLDATPLMYLKTPKEMFASLEMSQILGGIFFLAILIFVSVYLFLKLHSPPEKEKRGIGETEKRKTKRFTDSPIHPFTDSVRNSVGVELGGAGRRAGIFNFITILFLTVCLIIPIRGGFQLAAINQSHVYFSKNSFANHAAVNVPWNFCHSIVERSFEKTNPYNYLPEEEAKEIVKELFKTTSIQKQGTGDEGQGTDEEIRNLKSPDFAGTDTIQNPNVLLIILESFTSKLIGSLGGEKEITPNFNKLTKEGILFTNIYANGDRSDKGLSAILSGFPAQPARSIVMIPSKTANLSFISKIFKKKFYHTSFYYGGELEFANIKSYLINGGFDKIVGKDDFDPKDWNSKWGAHDHVVFDRLLDDLDITPTPFFATIFTLSSHEPFEIPKIPSLGGGREELDDAVAKFLNAVHYTDWSLGEFIKQAKNKAWWHNTLIIITADHGHRLPGYSALHQKEKFKIPMLWIGGVIEEGKCLPVEASAQAGEMGKSANRGMGNGIDKQVTTIDKIGSQTDIAKTLLNQIGFESKGFAWSKDLLAPGSGFAFYVFNDGFGYIDTTGYIIFDNISGNVMDGKNNVSKSTERKGQAYLQLSFQEYLDY